MAHALITKQRKASCDFTGYVGAKNTRLFFL